MRLKMIFEPCHPLCELQKVFLLCLGWVPKRNRFVRGLISWYYGAGCSESPLTLYHQDNNFCLIGRKSSSRALYKKMIRIQRSFRVRLCWLSSRGRALAFEFVPHRLLVHIFLIMLQLPFLVSFLYGGEGNHRLLGSNSDAEFWIFFFKPPSIFTFVNFTKFYSILKITILLSLIPLFHQLA